MYIKDVVIKDNEMLVYAYDYDGSSFVVQFPVNNQKARTFTIVGARCSLGPVHDHLLQKIFQMACEHVNSNKMSQEIIDLIISRVTLNRTRSKDYYAFIPSLKKGTRNVVAKEINRIINKHLFSDKKTVQSIE